MIWLAGALMFVSLAAVDVWTFWTIYHLSSPRPWWNIAVGAIAFGTALGMWLGAAFTYQVAHDLRYIGFPVPGLVLRLENDRWVDYVGPIPIIVPFNVFTVASCFLLPVSLGLAVQRLSVGRGDGTRRKRGRSSFVEFGWCMPGPDVAADCGIGSRCRRQMSTDCWDLWRYSFHRPSPRFS